MMGILETIKEKSVALLSASALLFLATSFWKNGYLTLLALGLLLTGGFFAASTARKFRTIRREFEVKTRGFSSLTENLSDGVILYDPDFVVLSMNRSLEALFGIDRRKFIGIRMQPKTLFQGNEAVFIQCLFPSLAPSSTQISEPDAWPQIVEISTENPPRKFLTSLSRVSDERGAVSYFIKTVRDATREHEISESKNEFISVAAHQLRTPLTSINWALESIAKDAAPLSEPIARTATEALRVSERALKIVNNLLEVAKMDEGGARAALERVEIAGFLREVVALTEPFAKERSISLFLTPVPLEWEGVAASIDKEQLGAALANLIENAVKYNSKNGEVSITLEVFPERRMLKISVKDTGVGIPEKDLNAVFGKFFRAKNVVTLEPDGSGLGLYIVKNIVERHGGRVGFESRENRGSTFWFTLPASVAGREAE